MHSTLDRKRIRTKEFLEIFSIRVSSIIYRQVCTSNYKFFSITSMNIKIIIIILSRNTKKAKEHTKASSHHQTYVALEYTLKFAAVTIHETFHSSVSSVPMFTDIVSYVCMYTYTYTFCDIRIRVRFTLNIWCKFRVRYVKIFLFSSFDFAYIYVP